MSVDEREFGRKIRTYLERSTDGLKPGTAYRLQAARQEALARLAGAPAHTGVVVSGDGSGALGGFPGARLLTRGSFWLALVALAGALLFASHWQELQRARELAEIDVQLLSAELPVDAFLDKGFRNWLSGAE